MKIYTLLFLILYPIVATAQWTKTAGPVETGATTVELVDTALILGTNGTGVFSSTDNGGHWNKITSYPDSAVSLPISKIVYHAAKIYVANTDHIYVSSDHATSFQYSNAGLPDTLRNYDLYNANNTLYATAQIIDPITFNTITNFYYYNDFTTLWQQVGHIPAGYTVTSVAALHDTIYCAMFGHGIYYTHANGAIWDSLNANNGALGSNNIRLLAAYGQKIYAIAYDNIPVLYSSTDGRSWASTTLSFTGGNTITTMAVRNDTICLGSPGATYVSPNGGSTWRSTPIPYYSVNEIKYKGNRIIAADPGSGFIYTTNDSNWYTSNAGLNYSTPYHLAYAYNNLYAMDAYNTFHTNNTGNSWTEDTDRLFNMSGITRMGNKLIGFSKYGQNDLHSFDGGQTWVFEGTPGVGLLVSRSIVNNANRKLYAWGQADVRRSDDYGKTWNSLFYRITYNTHDTLFTGMTQIRNRLFLTWTDPVAKLFYSDDTGAHWQQIVTGDFIYHVEAVDTTLIIGTNNGIKTSIDMGATFTTVNGGDLFQTYVNGATLFNFKGPFGNSIQYSTDHGATWADVSPSLDTTGSINDIMMDGSYLYAATNQHSVWKRSLSSIGITYMPDTTNNYIVNLGVNNITENRTAQVAVYPNPFTDKFNITVTTTAPQYIDVKLYDIAGRCVQVIAQNKYVAGMHTFTASTPLPGTYYVTTIVDGSVTTKKVVRY